ncbi:hypothetical protein WR25_25143 [Diploscapter pachys]|uniref:SXP/RAL-2 family protein Ani s 5-like cation-binding domain-containing protein n=1 Tax=Diploscapter pachys TaxID=2018661 RepID=A0A2A2LWG3_9BILA|nr:hypothetical protein WR25_25143 [Diploscapter pachys]
MRFLLLFFSLASIVVDSASTSTNGDSLLNQMKSENFVKARRIASNLNAAEKSTVNKLARVLLNRTLSVDGKMSEIATIVGAEKLEDDKALLKQKLQQYQTVMDYFYSDLYPSASAKLQGTIDKLIAMVRQDFVKLIIFHKATQREVYILAMSGLKTDDLMQLMKIGEKLIAKAKEVGLTDKNDQISEKLLHNLPIFKAVP